MSKFAFRPEGKEGLMEYLLRNGFNGTAKKSPMGLLIKVPVTKDIIGTFPETKRVKHILILQTLQGTFQLMHP